MADANILKQASNSGEFSPRMVARTDLEQYAFGAETLENVLLLQQGGWMRRPGFRFVGSVKDPSVKTHLLSFVFSTVQAYIIEAGNNYFRFFRDFGQVFADTHDAAITNGDFTSGIAGWTDLSTGTAAIAHDAVNGRLSLVNGVADIAIAEQSVPTSDTGVSHVLRFTVHGIPGDTVKLRIGNSSGGTELANDLVFPVGHHAWAFTPTVSPFFIQFRNDVEKTLQVDDVFFLSDEPAEIETPYLASEIESVQIAQSNDTLYMVHENHMPHKLLRFGNTSWSVVPVAFNDGPYLGVNFTTTTITPSAVTGLGITLTASAANGINDGLGFLATDVGRSVRLLHTSTWGYAVITGVTSNLIVTADVKRDFGAGTAVAIWRLGMWSDTTGYPRAVSFYESRLAMAANPIRPQTFWLSQTDDFENFQPDNGSGTVEDDDAISRTIASEKVNSILWIASTNQMVMGTAGGAWIVRSTNLDEPVTPANIQAKQQTTRKADDAGPVKIDQTVIYLQAGRRRVVGFALVSSSSSGASYQAFDLTTFAEHIMGSGGGRFVYQEEPHSLVWGLRDDGQAALLVYRPENEVLGWSRMKAGGSFGGGDAAIDAVASIPGNSAAGTEERDETWIIAQRTIAGQTVRYVEVQERDHQDGDDQSDAFYVDSGLTYDGPATDTLTGLAHLEGQTVQVLTEGAVHPDRVVTGAQITLDEEYTKAQIGLGYVSKYKSLKFDHGGVKGTAQTFEKELGRVGLVLDNALGVQIGDDPSRLFEEEFRDVEDLTDTAVPFFTGERIIDDFISHLSTDPRVFIEIAKPVPATVLAMTVHVNTNDVDG